MGRVREPVKLLKYKKKSHYSAEYLEERARNEIEPIADNLDPPEYLTKKQADRFREIAEQLDKLHIIGETDTEALARYVIAQDMYITTVKQLRKAEVKDDLDQFERWTRLQEKYWKQARTSANDLGLTITSRCKLIVPKIEPEPVKVNKFAAFERAGNND